MEDGGGCRRAPRAIALTTRSRPDEDLMLRFTKRKLGLLGALMACLVAAAVAYAEDYDFPPTKAGISGSVSPNTIGKTPKAIRLNLTTTLTAEPANRIPATVNTVTVWFPHGAVANGRLFPSCNMRRLDLRQGERKGVCDNGSLIGSLRTTGYYANLVEPIRADLYNASNGRAVLFYFFGDNPVLIRVPVLAPLVKLPKNHKYGYKLSMKIPRELQDPVPGTYASFRILKATTYATRKVKGKKRGYIEGHTCPRSGRVPLQIDYGFLDGQKASATSFIRCKRVR
jgi:hypothetical protein